MSSGLKVSGYEILEELGRGKFGKVYLARKGQKQFAIKAIEADSSQHAQDIELKFIRESSNLARLRSPHLVEIYEVGKSDHFLYQIMEFVDGPALASKTKKGALLEPFVYSLALSLAKALIEVHRHGLIHRDIKPSNIVLKLNAPNQAKLIDFGFATEIHPDADQMTEQAGTFNYCAPEQTGTLKCPVDARADLYSLGVVLYECATGSLPFESKDIAELLRLHAVAPVPDIISRNPKISLGLSKLISKLLAKDPNDRYQSAFSLLADLKQIDHINQELLKDNEVRLDTEFSPSFSDTPLIGREKEVSQLLEIFKGVAEKKKGALIVVEGSAGSGKSRILRQLLLLARRTGFFLLSVKCSLSDSMPLSALRQGVENLVHSLERLPLEEKEKAKQRLIAAAMPSAALLKRFSPALGLLLGSVPESLYSASQDEFFAAISDFLFCLSKDGTSIIIQIDDIQWLDPGTWIVVRQLTHEFSNHPILIACTARNDSESKERTELFCAENQENVTLQLKLEPLGYREAEELICYHLGGRIDNEKLCQHIIKLSQGNPFAIGEYIRTMLYSGLLRPFWGQWLASLEKADTLHLPSDVIQLVIRRIDQLSEKTKSILSIASVMGNRFALDILSEASHCLLQVVYESLIESMQTSLIERDENEGFRFVHDRVREAFLARLTEEALKETHQILAEAYDRVYLEAQGGKSVTEIARHYALGKRKNSYQKIYDWNRRAALFSLDSFANQDAYVFFNEAISAAVALGIGEDTELNLQMGKVCYRLGKLGDAESHYNKALEATTDRILRAQVLDRISEIHSTYARSKIARGVIIQAFEELGSPISQPNLPIYLMKSLGLSVFVFINFKSNTIQKWLETRDRKKHEIKLDLGFTAMWVFVALSESFTYVAVCLMTIFSASRVNSQKSLILMYSALGILVSAFGLRGPSDRALRKALQMAELSGNKVLIARVMAYQQYALDFTGRPNEATSFGDKLVVEFGSWLEQKEYFHCIEHLCNSALLLGKTREMKYWLDLASKRAKAFGFQTRLVEEHVNTVYRGACLAIQGSSIEAATVLKEYRARLGNAPDDVYRWNYLVTSEIVFYLEQNELGAPLDQSIDDYEGLPLHVLLELDLMIFKQYYILKGYARMAQAFAAVPGSLDQKKRIRQLKKAVFELRRVCFFALCQFPLHISHFYVIKSGLCVLLGKVENAKVSLEQAEILADQIGNVWVLFEVARMRARVWLRQEKVVLVKRDASSAFIISQNAGWNCRSRQVLKEFGNDLEIASVQNSHYSSELAAVDSLGFRLSKSGSTLDLERFKNRHKVLLDLSLALTSSLDPILQSRKVLDGLVKILNAERAFLFLIPDRGERIELVAGRDHDGNELVELTGYSRTIVQRVQETRQPIVVSGREEGASLGSESVIFHNLRSVIAAPLLIQDRFLGIIYLDNRLASGVFSWEDLDIFTALASQIAISFEMSRIARIEIEKRILDQELSNRKRIQMIMDNLTEGFITFDSEGVIQSGVSRAAFDLFQEDPQGKNLTDLLHRSPKEATELKELFRLFFQSGVPFETLKSFAPSNITVLPDTYLELDYRQIKQKDGGIETIILIATDKTKQRKFELKALEEKSYAKMIITVLKNKSIFIRFVVDTKHHLDRIDRIFSESPSTQWNISDIYQTVHTIKGEAGSFGIETARSLAHTFESKLSEVQLLPSGKWGTFLEQLQDGVRKIGNAMSEFLKTNEAIFGVIDEKTERQRQFPMHRVNDFLSRLRSEFGLDSQLAQDFYREFLLDPIENLFTHYEAAVYKLAEELGKSVEFKIVKASHPLLVEGGCYDSMAWSLIHVFRNALDHGIESPSERKKLGKLEQGKIEVAFSEENGWIKILIRDDGRGIDPKVIGKIALEKGIWTAEKLDQLAAHETIQAVFAPGFSSKSSVTDFSGRGVGLDALQTEVHKLGGKTWVESQLGEGTSLFIQLPRQVPQQSSREQPH